MREQAEAIGLEGVRLEEFPSDGERYYWAFRTEPSLASIRVPRQAPRSFGREPGQGVHRLRTILLFYLMASGCVLCTVLLLVMSLTTNTRAHPIKKRACLLSPAAE